MIETIIWKLKNVNEYVGEALVEGNESDVKRYMAQSHALESLIYLLEIYDVNKDYRSVQLMKENSRTRGRERAQRVKEYFEE